MLQRAGFQVALIDRDEPGAGCSAGNAGVIANSFVLPLSSFANIRAAPGMLLDKQAPLSMPLRHLGDYAPWLWKFALNALNSRRETSIQGLRPLNFRALSAWKELLGPSIAERHIFEHGMLDVVALGRSNAGLRDSAKALRKQGVSVEDMSAHEVAELEPSLAGRVGGGLFHTNVAHVSDPLMLSLSMLDMFRAAGGQVKQFEVTSIETNSAGVVVHGEGSCLSTQFAVVAAGWWSSSLIQRFGLVSPLRAERGYHLMLDGHGTALSRPVSFFEESFLATPLANGLRLAGTVELAPPHAKPNWERSESLRAKAMQYLPEIAVTPASRWFGSRPSFPDSLPAIGRVPGAPSVIYAYGHQHLGLTQAAVTAEYVLSLMRGDMPEDIERYSLERFGLVKPSHFSARQTAMAS